MAYKAISFEPGVSRDNPSASIASSLDALVRAEASAGWEFVGVQNHSTLVPGAAGCFGIGATPPYPQTFSIAVFRQ